MLEIEVCKIEGTCSVHDVGDELIIDGSRMIFDKTAALCVHALSSLLNYLVPFDEDVKPVNLCLSTSGDKEHAYIVCVDHGAPYTNGCTVIFRSKKTQVERSNE